MESDKRSTRDKRGIAENGNRAFRGEDKSGRCKTQLKMNMRCYVRGGNWSNSFSVLQVVYFDKRSG